MMSPTGVTRSHPLSIVAQRPALLKAWRRSQERQLTLIVAPPGYGKTTLLRTWWARCVAAKERTAWLSLHAFDSDASALQKLIAAIEAADPGALTGRGHTTPSRPPLQVLRAALGAALDAFAARGEELTLFVDNCAACSPEIHRMFGELLTVAPASLHLIMAVRVRPGLLPLASLAARDELVLVGCHDLSFELADTQRFVLEVLELSLAPQVLRKLHERAEGWPAGVRLLCSDPLRQGGDVDIASTAATLLFDNFFSHALRHLPDAVVRGLELLSCLTRWSPAMAEAMLAADGAELLELLIGSAFFACDASAGHYRLHGLLADYLRRRYATQYGRAAVRELRREAAVQLAKHSYWADSVEQAFAADDAQSALRAAEQCALDLVDKGETAQVRSWLQRLDPAQVYRHPKLCLAGALLHYACREPELALQYLDAGAAQSLAADNATDGEVLRQLQLLRAIYPICCDDSEAGRRALARGLGVPAGGALSEPASAVCEAWCLIYEQGPAVASTFLKQRQTLAGHRADTVDLHRQNLAGLAALLAADLDQGVQIYGQMLIDARRVQGPDGPMVALAAAGLARHAYERGEFDEVDTLLRGPLAMIDQSGSIEGMMAAYHACIRTECARGAFSLAAENLAKVQAIAQAHRLDRLETFCRVENLFLCITQHHLQEAQAFSRELRDLSPRRGDRRSVAGATLRMAEYAKAMLLIALGEPQFAVESLEEVANDAYSMGFFLEAASSLTLLAIALNLTARRREARKHAVRAMLIGQKTQLLRTFVDCGPGFAPLLQDLRRERLAGKHAELRCEYLDYVLANLSRTRSLDPAPPVVGLGDTTLSSRELEITALLSTGLSNKEIGRTMRLSNETVKWHLKNIYDKLGVEDRADAISKAIRLVR
jgi:LuxR family transcriptional regulator, maltose regulon positive regulatory protein